MHTYKVLNMKRIQTDTISDEPKYSIGTAASILSLSIHTLRKYEANGLIISHRNSGRQRRYSDRDIERIRCIHTAINEEKISIEGIKRMLALTPCWALISCTQEERVGCPAYRGSSGPCWEQKHEDTICASKDCRTCIVYQEAGSCRSLKDLLKATLQ
jgi:MerR family transcriptional regulator/heat shock protein HspR